MNQEAFAQELQPAPCQAGSNTDDSLRFATEITLLSAKKSRIPENIYTPKRSYKTSNKHPARLLIIPHFPHFLASVPWRAMAWPVDSPRQPPNQHPIRRPPGATRIAAVEWSWRKSDLPSVWSNLQQWRIRWCFCWNLLDVFSVRCHIYVYIYINKYILWCN